MQQFYDSRLFSLESACPQKTGGIGLLHAGEVREHLHQVARVTTTQNLVTHILTRLGIQCAALCKDIGDIDCQHFRPQVTVVACCIATTPYVVEIAGTVAWGNLIVEQTNLTQGLGLELSSLFGRRYIL